MTNESSSSSLKRSRYYVKNRQRFFLPYEPSAPYCTSISNKVLDVCSAGTGLCRFKT